MRDNKTLKLVICAFAIALNVVLGYTADNMALFLSLGSLGLILIAAVYGMGYGVMVGIASTVIKEGLSGNVKNMAFAIVNVVMALIIGAIAKKFKFNLKTAVIAGIIIGVVAPLIGTPISIVLSGGVTGQGTDALVLFLRQTGHSVFASAFIPRIYKNLLEKTVDCILVAIILRYLPLRYKKTFMDSQKFSA